MASAPPQPPESIILGSFSGIKNTVSSERLKTDELERAINVDIDDGGQVRRRRGYLRKLTGNCHSLKKMGDITIMVRDGVLGTVTTGPIHTPLVSVGQRRVAAVRVVDTIYFSSEGTTGKIIDNQVLPWGSVDGNGIWVSPVIRPTETLGAIRGKKLVAPPNATDLEAYHGRIYMAAGPVLWVTELYLYDLIDKTRNFITFESDITMLAAVDDGIYVGTTENLYFLGGNFSTGLKRSIVMGVGVLPGSAVVVPYVKVDPRARGGQPVPEGQGPVFMTNAGICVGFPGGTAFNLTQDRAIFPRGLDAAALYREDQGANSYVAVVNSAGGPSANARIGDYVDAEVIRASQQ